MQDAHDRKQRTLEPPALRWRTLASYAPLRAEGSESVPAVVCASYATSLAKLRFLQLPDNPRIEEVKYGGGIKRQERCPGGAYMGSQQNLRDRGGHVRRCREGKAAFRGDSGELSGEAGHAGADRRMCQQVPYCQRTDDTGGELLRPCPFRGLL